jgi:outer membrane protein assembly factor BamB
VFRSLLTALVLLVPLALAVADDTDPEPPPRGAIAKSGGLTVTATRDGDVVARDKNQKVVWRVRLGKGKSASSPQLGIGGPRVLHARDDTLIALDLKTGKTLWQTTGPALADTKLQVDASSITLTSNDAAVAVAVDPQSGRYTYKVLTDIVK